MDLHREMFLAMSLKEAVAGASTVWLESKPVRAIFKPRKIFVSPYIAMYFVINDISTAVGTNVVVSSEGFAADFAAITGGLPIDLPTIGVGGVLRMSITNDDRTPHYFRSVIVGDAVD